MEIVNRVAESGLINIDPADFIKDLDIAIINLRDFLEEGIVLREKNFREKLKKTDWSAYKNQNVGVVVDDGLLIPQWAPMLMATYLLSVAKAVNVGDEEKLRLKAFEAAIDQIDLESYKGKNIIIKGCGDGTVPAAVYVQLIARLAPVANRIAYGEACSSVPLFKR
jgi:hypothetical protein